MRQVMINREFESPQDSTRLLTEQVIDDIFSRIINSVNGNAAGTSIQVHGWWNSELKLSRNRISLSSHRRDLRVSVSRIVNGRQGTAVTNQIDDESLKAVTHTAERYARLSNGRVLERNLTLDPPVLSTPKTEIWSDQTYNLPAKDASDIVVYLSQESEKHNMLAAGYLELRTSEMAGYAPELKTPRSYNRYTQAQCSMTVRHPQGLGSGWAGLSSYDWPKLNARSLVELAVDKCLKSLNPVAIEPGRFTLIMEPQALADMFEMLFLAFESRTLAEGSGTHPLFLGPDTDFRIGRSKLGLKILDERINVYHDPNDPLLGVLPVPGMEPVKWIEKGVAKAIGHGRDYALSRKNVNVGDLWRLGYRMDGGNATIDGMIESTQRGLLVTRFWNIRMLDQSSVLTTGVSRDGLWLIENGKITKAVKNMRFTESIMFSLNQLESLGTPVPVFRPVRDPYSTAGLSPAIVPPVKVNDFSFTSMIDAV